jgi:ABC-type glycerol-3-phosphate transport system permease component
MSNTYRFRRKMIKTSILLVLSAISIIMLAPFLTMLVQATHSSKEILQTPPPFLPGVRLAENYANVMSVIPFWNNFLNSAILASCATVLSLLFCSMGGYAFAIYEFPLKRQLFATLLFTMMLPGLVNLVPWFIIVTRLGWMDNFAAVIVPSSVSAFGIFWMRQYIASSVPTALVEAARIDGCQEGLIFFRVVAPLLGPAFGALGIMNFIGSWNSFFYPMLVLTRPSVMTVPLAINLLRGDPYRGMDYGTLMLASTMALTPVMLVFWAASRRFIAGMTAGAVKG